MRIAVIGGGFTGLVCAQQLVEKGVGVVLFEEGKALGGLAGGIKMPGWRWSLEYFYHHVFTNDREILGLAKKVGVTTQIKKPVTTSFVNKKELQLDSPISVLRFTELSLWARIRMGAGLAFLKFIPNGEFLEKYKVVDMLPKLIGRGGYQLIWERLLESKFGPYSKSVNMAWFWTRVAKRTKNLGYFEGGFQNLADKIGIEINKLGGEIKLGTKVKSVKREKNGSWKVNGESFDGVVMTAPAPVTEKLLMEEKIVFPKLSYLWGQTVILELNKKTIRGYWMNILEKKWPFLVLVEHTNMIDKKYYGNNRVVYLGNYLPEGDKQLKMTKDQLIAMYLPYLRKVNKTFRKKWIKSVSVFRRPYAQPVFPVNYSRQLPKMKTEYKGLYLANMSMVYPFDRGTNYAVNMGMDVAKQLLRDLR